MSGAWVSAVLLLVTASDLCGQTLLHADGITGAVNIFNTDSAVLESQDLRKDLPCTVTSAKPALGFDLKFRAGYEVSLPIKELAGTENSLTMIFRVVPDSRRDEPVYLSQRIKVPEIEEDAKGDADLQGSFVVGEGRYHIDWLMRDRGERVCSWHGDIEASLPPKDKEVALEIQPGQVEAIEREPFRLEGPVEREPHKGPLNVKVLVNFAPQAAGSATLQPLDTNALVSILRSIAREPRIGRYSMVAFNLQEQRVLYRQEDAPQIDFPALGDALRALNLGTVDVKRLGQKRGETTFLTNLITKEMDAPDHPDAVIFAGPKAMLDDGVPQESLKKVADLEYPVFYMNYNLNPQAVPWRDAIGNAVKYLKGFEYTISRPRDLWYAWGDIMSRIVKLKVERRTASAASR